MTHMTLVRKHFNVGKQMITAIWPQIAVFRSVWAEQASKSYFTC